MRAISSVAALAALVFTTSVSGLNILLGNDDGFASAQVRETYRLLKHHGHTVVLVASADNQSGKGGLSVFTNNNTLQYPSEYGIIPAGAPSLGQDPIDPGIWYYNGTPAAAFFVGIDYILPNLTNISSVDLVVAGPNFGTNLGGFVWTLSGTAGYTYSAVGRGIPAISFSGGNGEQRSYQWINSTTASGYPDPAIIQAQLAVNLVQTLINNTRPGERLMPLGYGLNVNTPFITSLTNDTCVNPPFIQSRMSGGGALSDIAVRNATTGLFKYGDIVGAGLNVCINGDCHLPGETAVLHAGCQASVSVFTVDYDAPSGRAQDGLRRKLYPLVKHAVNGTLDAKGPKLHHLSARDNL